MNDFYMELQEKLEQQASLAVVAVREQQLSAQLKKIFIRFQKKKKWSVSFLFTLSKRFPFHFDIDMFLLRESMLNEWKSSSFIHLSYCRDNPYE